jgi:hypothetical protein
MSKDLGRSDYAIDVVSAVLPFGPTVGLEAGKVVPVQAAVADSRQGKADPNERMPAPTITVSNPCNSARSASDRTSTTPRILSKAGAVL